MCECLYHPGVKLVTVYDEEDCMVSGEHSTHVVGEQTYCPVCDQSESAILAEIDERDEVCA